MLLSVANIMMDFSGLLNEIESEQRLADQIEQGSSAARASEKKKHENDRDRELTTLDTAFIGRTSPAEFCEQEERKQEIRNRCDLKVQLVEDASIEMLEKQLTIHRDRLQRIKGARKGRTTIDKYKQHKVGALEEYEKSLKVFKAKKEQVQQEADKAITEIDPSEMSPEAFEEQIHNIEQGRDKKLNTIEGQINKQKARFTGDPAVIGLPSSP